MKKIIILIVSLLSITSITEAQKTVNIDGLTINLDEVPLNSALKIPVKRDEVMQDGRTLTKQKVFASDNKKFIAIASTYINSSDSKVATFEGELKIYNATGSLKWKAIENNRKIAKSSISEEGNISHVIWRLNEESINYEKLITYDINGTVINEINDFNQIFLGKDKTHIYYFKDAYYTDNTEHLKKLFYKNFKTGDSWEKAFSKDNPLNILSISESGENLVVSSDKIYFLDNLGNIRWEKEFTSRPGAMWISPNGEYLLRKPAMGKIIIYNNHGEVILTKENYTIDGQPFMFNRGSFIENSDNIFVFADILSREESRIAFFDLEGELKDSFIINTGINSVLNAIQTNDNVAIYHKGVKVYEYQKNW